MKMNFTESRLSNIIRESIDKLLLTEDRGSRSMKSARNDAVSVLGDKQQAVDYVNKVRNQLELHNDAEAFVLGGTRMKLNGEYDNSTKDKLISVIRLIASKYIDSYNNDLNGLSAQELIGKHSNELQSMRDNERNEVGSMEFNGKSDYDIVRIDSFKQASEYSVCTPWCVTCGKDAFNEYTSNGVNQFYFCFKDGFKQVPEEKGENYPLDEYGLSMFAVRVNENGDLIGCTTRWNVGDNAMNVKQISTVIGMDFYGVFKPNTKWKDTLETAMQRLANGEDPRDVFDGYDEFSEGFARIRLDDKWNYINQNGELLTELPTADESIKGKWFNYCEKFKDGMALVELSNEKENYILTDGKPLSKELWFDSIINIGVKGLKSVRVGGKYNALKMSGGLLTPDHWFDQSFMFNPSTGLAIVKYNGNTYRIDAEGNFYDIKTREPIKPPMNENVVNIDKIISESIQRVMHQIYYKK